MKMEMIANNPAGRLLEIVEQGRKISDNTNALAAWSELLNIPVPQEISLILKRISDFYTLSDEIARLVGNIKGIDESLYLQWRTKAKPAFQNINFQAKWLTVFKSRFDDSVVYGLRFCNDLLAKQRPEKSVAITSVKDIAGKVSELIEEIEQESLDEETKGYIKERLIDISEALNSSRILGIKPIEKELNITIGSLAINNNYKLQSEGSEFKKKFWRVIYGISLLVTTTAAGFQIEERIVKALPEQYRVPVQEQVVEFASKNQRPNPSAKLPVNNQSESEEQKQST